MVPSRQKHVLCAEYDMPRYRLFIGAFIVKGGFTRLQFSDNICKTTNFDHKDSY